jgi:CheY-like chemotaxis protein
MLNQIGLLYVEDDPLSREIMQMMCSAMGIDRFTMFDDSTDFMPRLKRLAYKPDVILLDIHLTPLDGFALLDMLRRDPAFDETIVVALTASVMNEEVNRLRSSGFDGAVAKPLSIQTFPELMERIVQREPVWHIA